MIEQKHGREKKTTPVIMRLVGRLVGRQVKCVKDKQRENERKKTISESGAS
jgi:hypothetical protein